MVDSRMMSDDWFIGCHVPRNPNDDGMPVLCHLAEEEWFDRIMYYGVNFDSGFKSDDASKDKCPDLEDASGAWSGLVQSRLPLDMSTDGICVNCSLESWLPLDVSTDGISFVAHKETNVFRARPNSGVKCHPSINISTFGNVGSPREEWLERDRRQAKGRRPLRVEEIMKLIGHGYGPGKDAPGSLPLKKGHGFVGTRFVSCCQRRKWPPRLCRRD